MKAEVAFYRRLEEKTSNVGMSSQLPDKAREKRISGASKPDGTLHATNYGEYSSLAGSD